MFTFFTDIKEKPFDHPMGMNLVSETYPFPWISLPTDEELADPEKTPAVTVCRRPTGLPTV